MIFLQALYGLILASLLQVDLSAKSHSRYSALLSVERKHRALHLR